MWTWGNTITAAQKRGLCSSTAHMIQKDWASPLSKGSLVDNHTLLVLPNLLKLIIWKTVKTYLRWKCCHGFPGIFQYIASDRTFTAVTYSNFTVNSYDYFLNQAGLFSTKLSLTTSAWTQIIRYRAMNHQVTKSPFFYNLSRSHVIESAHAHRV